MTLNPAVSDVACTHAFDTSASMPPSRSPTRSAARETIDSHALLRGGRELVIVHGEHEYRLRLTQNDKLILTK
ncbi:MAG: hemin uptake protein HemP [Aquimonas sp.]|jgi:hemin uptake protein HemP